MVASSSEAGPAAPESPVAAAEAWLIERLGLQACWYEAFPFDEQLPRIEPGRIVLPAAEPGIAPWSCDQGVELPVRANSLLLGRFVLVPRSPTVGVGFPAEERAAAVSLADDVGELVAAAMLAKSA